MDKVLISWSIPNMITIWLMLFAGLFVLAIVSQLVLKRVGMTSSTDANNAGGY